jgi:hypothetical protein
MMVFLRTVKWYFVFVLPASDVSGVELRGLWSKVHCLRILGSRVEVSSGAGGFIAVARRFPEVYSVD